jgi:myosin heavy subunit
MAQKEISLKITVDGKEIDLAKTSINSFEKAYTDAQSKLATLKLGSEEWKKLDAEVKKAGVAFLEAKDSMKATDDVNKSLRTRLRETRTEIEKLEEAGQTNTARFRELRQTYDELNDAQEVARFRAGQLDDQLAALPGPIGKVGQGFKGLNDSLKVLATNPFFLVITVVVGTLGLLKKALDSTAEGQKTLAKFTDALQKVMGPFLALLEAVAVPLFNFLADIILKVAEGFAFFAEKVGISSDKIKQAQSGIEDFAAEEKRLAEEKEKRDAEAAEKEKQRLEDKKARQAAYDAKRKEADKVNEEARLALMTESDRRLAEEETKHQENLKKLRAAGYKNTQLEEKRHTKEIEKINKESYDALLKLALDQAKAEAATLNKTGDLQKEQEIKELETRLNLIRAFGAENIDVEMETFNKINDLQARELRFRQAERIKAFETEREEQRKNSKEIILFDINTAKGKAQLLNAQLVEMSNFYADADIKRLELIKKFDDQEKVAQEKSKENTIKNYDEQLRLLELKNMALQKGTIAFFKNQEDLLNLAYEKERFLAKDNADKLIEIEKKYQIDKKNLKDQELQAIGQVASQTINAIAAVTGAIAQGYAAEANNTEKTMQQREAAFEKNKQYQLATAYMSAASGVIQILTQPSTLPSPFDWIVKGINAAALLVATRINTNTIKNTKFQGGASAVSAGGTQYADGNFRGYATGGLINGPGSGTSDSIPARLSNGESVINANSTAMFLPLLSAINSMGGGTAFNSNTMVASNDKPMTKEVNEPIIMRAYVVENEMTSIQQRQARLKELSVL